MNPARILVVDDNPSNLKLASEVLKLEGHELLQAADAETARQIAESLLPDLILLDIALPGMDGLELTRILKASSATRQIVIVALTAFAMKGDEERAMEAGFDAYVTKPIDVRTFPGLVAGLLARSCAGRDEAQ